MKVNELKSEKLNEPIGVFSQAIEVVNPGKTVYVSGITSRAKDGSVVGEGDIKVQTETILLSIQAILAESNLTLDDVVKMTLYIRDMDMFSEIHEVRAKYFSKPYPAAAMLEVSRMVSKEHLIEIDAIAVGKA